MKKISLSILLWLCMFISTFAQKIPILPIPQKVEVSNGRLRFNKKLNIVISQNQSEKIRQAINRFQFNWEKKTLIKVSNLSSLPSDLNLQVDEKWKGQSSSLEEYELKIQSDISLKAKSDAGILHGLESLAQLIQSDSVGYFLPQVKISDWPRFKHRGLMIDVARHFIPLDRIQRSIDAMAASKMNVLHLHLSDDEGFRIESKKYPLLHQKGSNGEYFTQAEIAKIVSYAADRNIEVIPEFDLPGHSKSWFVGYKDLASEDKEYTIGPRFVIEEGAKVNLMSITQMINSQATPTINPANEKTYKFLEGLFKEMAALFPSPYFHIGMDENNGIAWKNNPSIQAFMKSKKIANEHELQAYFGERLNQILKKIGKKTVVWEEGFHPNMSKDMLVQLWKPAMMGKVLQAHEVASNQQQTIISRGFYLDYFMSSAFHYMNPEILNLKSDEGVLGGEAAIWTELVDKNNFELRIWPRAISVAARLWSAKEEQNVSSFYQNLQAFDQHLISLGLQHQAQSENHLQVLLGEALSDTDRELFGILTPLRGFKRLMNVMTQPTSNQFSHFEQFADALPSDSYAKMEFRDLIKTYLQDKLNVEKRNQLIAQLNKWASLYTYVEKKSKKSINLQPLLPLVKQISYNCQLVSNKLNMLDAKSEEEILREISKLKKTAVSDLECVISDELESIVNGKLKEIDLKLSLF